MAADRTDAPDFVDVVVPQPVVTWKSVVQAENPTRSATVGRLRELRNKHHVASGVTVPLRGQRKLSGRATYFSVLSVLAAKSRHEGEADAAVAMVRAAEQLESRFAEQLKAYLGDHPLSDLPHADFFYDLAASTAVHVAAWSEHASTLLAAAEVDQVHENVAHLEGASPQNGEAVAVDLPRALVDSQALGAGDLVWVFSRFVGNAALVDLLPALRLRLRAASLGRKLLALSAFLGAGPAGSDRSDDGMTDDERRASANQFWATVGAKLTADDLARLKASAAAGQFPRRRLRPAG